ncbi:succinylglutamate desuccinylase [Colwellia sp. D2M02]|uniref:succinylglutamate desuccinylase n=1 Tax=Colwellia sp. D2M02 TaxID=2841562 RepID=UPI001C085EA9|nr:succinylglutamate desuccinylase [Colwellia sp. D2M02]MBU2894861.1 succinylglutamate desuccinylase [Colwellia sp. D2M02]
MVAHTISQQFTANSSELFKNAFRLFIKNGDFLGLTRQFEHSFDHKFSDDLSSLTFRVTAATATLIDTGVLLIEPDSLLTAGHDKATFNKNIIISSGIHGNETAPIEIVQQIVNDIIQGKTQVKHRTLFIIGNPVSMNIAKRFQGENLNRLFCGKHQSITPCYEKYRAEKLEQYVTDFFTAKSSITDVEDSSTDKQAKNYHYDLHTAIRSSKYEKFAIYPYQDDKPWDKEQLTFMAACGVNTILFGHAPSGTFSYFSSANFSAHAFTVELGKVKAFGENDMQNFTAMYSNLTRLVSAQSISLDLFDNSNFTLFNVLNDITKHSDDFKLLIDNDVKNFTSYPIGTQLSSDNGNDYITRVDGESIVFPNANVGIGQRAALMVAPCKL